MGCLRYVWFANEAHPEIKPGSKHDDGADGYDQHGNYDLWIHVF